VALALGRSTIYWISMELGESRAVVFTFLAPDQRGGNLTQLFQEKPRA
jgi:hypothetical protein